MRRDEKGKFMSNPITPLTLREHRFRPTMEVLQEMEAPRVLIPAHVAEDIGAIISLSGDMEVAFYGIVERSIQGDNIEMVITRLFLAKQKVAGATCEMDKQWQVDLKRELVAEGGNELYNKLRFWGHVHPGNDCTPSDQDIRQALKFGKYKCPYYLCGICGKDGSMEFRYYDFEKQLMFDDIPWSIPIKEADTALMEKWGKEFDEKVSEFREEPLKHGAMMEFANHPTELPIFSGGKPISPQEYRAMVDQRLHNPSGGTIYDKHCAIPASIQTTAEQELFDDMNGIWRIPPCQR